MVDTIIDSILNEKLDVNLDFEVSSYHFKFYDLIIMGADIPNLYEAFSDSSPQVTVNFENAFLNLVFNLDIV